MKEELISLETAKLAKEKGFDWGCDYFYHKHKTPYITRALEYDSDDGYVEDYNWNNGYGSYPTKAEDVLCSAPTQSILQKWLREKHNIVVYILPHAPNKKLDDGVRLYSACLWYKNEYQSEIKSDKTYEGALEKGLQEALKLIDNE